MRGATPQLPLHAFMALTGTILLHFPGLLFPSSILLCIYHYWPFFNELIFIPLFGAIYPPNSDGHLGAPCPISHTNHPVHPSPVIFTTVSDTFSGLLKRCFSCSLCPDVAQSHKQNTP
jgi:hypothetical protein